MCPLELKSTQQLNNGNYNEGNVTVTHAVLYLSITSSHTSFPHKRFLSNSLQ